MLDQPTLAPADVAATVRAAWAQYLTAGRGSTQTPHDAVYASAWRVCERRMVYELTDADKLPPWAPETLAKFKRGEDRERDLLIDLARVGRLAQPEFQVIGQQERFRLKDRKGRLAISGKVDARLSVNGWLAPLEVKAWSPQLVDRIETFADLFENPWTRSGGHQLLAYLYGAGEPYGFLLLDRSGLPLLVPVELDAHLDRMEDFLARAERVLDHKDAGTLPPFLEGDAAECQRCGFFGSVCQPPLTANVATVLTDPDLEAALERRESLKAAADEFDDLDKQIKKQLRGVEQGIVGPFFVEGKWSKSSRVDLPPELKKQYTVSIEKGRFTLHITRL
jgi:hypothetical protein